MPERVYISLCDGRRSRYANSLVYTRYRTRVPFFAAVILTLLVMLAVYPMPFYGGRATAGPGTTNLSDTTLSLTSSTSETSVTLNPGVGFNLSLPANTATYNVISNNFSGYTLKIKADDDNKTLVNTDDNTKFINSVTSMTEQSSFIPSATGLMNRWGIKPSKYYDSTNNVTVTNTTKILPGPTTTGIILDKTTAANSIANDYDIALGAMVDDGLPAGTYTRNTTLEAVANDIYYAINYNKNTAAQVDNMPEDQIDTVFASKITLDSAIPTRSNYTFTGWCLGSTTTADNVDSCTGTTFQPGDDFGIDQTTANISTLYAMWSIDHFVQTTRIRLQNADGTYPSTYTTVDTKDVDYGDTYSWSTADITGFDSVTYVASNVSYTVTAANTNDIDIERNTTTITLTAGTGVGTVAVSGNGVKTGGTAGSTSIATIYYGGEAIITATPNNDYMFENWTGSSTYTDNPKTITNITSSLSFTANGRLSVAMQNLPASQCTSTPKVVTDIRDNQEYTVQRLGDGNCWMVDNLNLGAATMRVSSLSSANTNISSEISLTTFDSWRRDKGNTTSSYTDGQFVSITTENSATGSDIDATSQNKFGTLYNYCAASAGTICISSNTENATQDICPAGWHLPVGGTSGDFVTLTSLANYNSNTKLRTPVSGNGPAFSLAGYFNGAAFGYQNSYGRYWTSTKYTNATNMYAMSISSSNTTPAPSYSNGRAGGLSMRCVLDNTPEMQNISYDTLSSLMSSTSSYATLKDNRDGQKYTVAKLADGNIWMIDNLNLGATNFTEKLTSTNTNITGEINASTFLGWKVSSGSYNDYSKYEYIPVDGSDATSLTKYGTLYNYRVATAGTIYGDKNSNDATQDICPAGWRLPTGGSSGEFQGLKTAYSTLANLQAPITSSGAAFARAGIFTNTPTYQNQRALYLSSTRGSDTATAGFGLVNGTIQNPYNLDRRAGLSIRCIYNKTATMQNFSGADADAMSVGETRTLVDSRDNQDYTVTKLSDGNVWMTRNLAIGCDGKGSTYGANNVATTLTSVKSDTTNYTTPTTKANTAASLTTAKQLCDSTYGAYYNYAAATANNINTSSTEVEATASVCPKGWRLPTWAEQTAITNYVSQFNPTVGGYTNGGNPGYTNYGFWWSSTANGATSRHVLRYYSGSSKMDNDATNESRGLAFYIRCVKREDRTISDIANMQDINPEIVANTANNATKVLRDTRDNQDYNVTKINGNLWMTRNLAIGCNGSGTTYGSSTSSKALTSANSNVSSSISTPTATLATSAADDSDYSTARMICNSTYGAWYNYAAASAKTITGNSNSTAATYDICPKGWRLPTNAEFNSITSYVTAFNPVAGGRYNSGDRLDTGNGYWWGSTASNATYRYRLMYEQSANTLTVSTNLRYGGRYVRCIAK